MMMKRNLISVLLYITIGAILHFALEKPPKIEVIEVPQVDIAKEVAKHVVPWISDSATYRRSATGFYIKYRGKYRILTNKHVCDAQIKRNKSYFIQFGDYVGRILYIDKYHDLCLVSSNRESGLELADYQSTKLEKITLVGYPRGIGKVVREGRVIELDSWFASWIGRKVISYRISSPAYPGNSGSPVVNTKGKVTGVLFAGSPLYPLEPFMVPLSYVRAFLNESIFKLRRPSYLK